MDVLRTMKFGMENDKHQTTLDGVKTSEDWLSYWDADKGLTKDGHTLLEFIKMIQADAYSAGDSHGYAEGYRWT